MTSAERNAINRKNVVGKLCDCGRSAFAWKRGDYVCERCDRIENMRKSEEISESLKRRYDIAKHRARFGDGDNGILQAA
jgi:hypothetical protein